jgi:hypothetical protein
VPRNAAALFPRTASAVNLINHNAAQPQPKVLVLMLEVQRSLGRFWCRFVFIGFSHSVPLSKTDSLRKLSSTSKPQIPSISQILTKLSRMSVRIFSWQKFRGIDDRNLLNPCFCVICGSNPFSVFGFNPIPFQSRLRAASIARKSTSAMAHEIFALAQRINMQSP